MKVSLLRSNSTGLPATYANADHHAQNLLPLIRFLEAGMPMYSFDEWVQGNNVHLLKSSGRTLVFRPVQAPDKEYIGLKVSVRVSRSNEIEIMYVQHNDFDKWRTLQAFLVAFPAISPF